MNQKNTYCYLSHFDLFEEIPEEELMKQASSMHGKNYTKGEVIYSPHKETDLIYVIKEGEVMLYHSVDGKKEGFDTIGPGTLFGNFNPETNVPSHFAEASRDSMVCVFPIKEFLEVLRHNPGLMMKFIQDMASRLQDYEKRFKNNLQSAKDTIYDELIRLKEKKKKGLFGKFFGEEGPPLRLTHEQIATLTGLNRVTVTRSIKELKEDGLLAIDPNSGVIELFSKE